MARSKGAAFFNSTQLVLYRNVAGAPDFFLGGGEMENDILMEKFQTVSPLQITPQNVKHRVCK